MLNKTSKAFSMIELLLSLVVISCIIAALVPIFTKRMISKSAGSTTQVQDLFLDINSANTESNFHKCGQVAILNDVKILKCQLKNIDTNIVNTIIVGAGGGGGGAAGGYMTGHNIHVSGDSSFSITPNMVDYRVTLQAGGGAGGGAVLKTSGTSITANKSTNADALSFEASGMQDITATLIGAPGGGGGSTYLKSVAGKRYISKCPQESIEVSDNSGELYCITKYNLRPSDYNQYHYNYDITNLRTFQHPQTGGAAIEHKVPITLKNGASVVNAKDKACWITNFSKCSSNSGYSGCGRTVCNYWAASAMCPLLTFGGNTCSTDGINFNESCTGKWRLPTGGEANTPDTSKSVFYRNYQGLHGSANSLQMCDDTSGKTPYCARAVDCSQSFEGNTHNTYGARPNLIWTQSEYASCAIESADSDVPILDKTAMYLAKVSNGTYSRSCSAVQYPRSVRCILQASGTWFSTYAGASGASGGKLVVSIPNQYVPNSAYIYIKGGTKGAGGAAGANGTKGQDGNNGGDTYIRIYKEGPSTANSNLLYGIILSGGGGGQGGASKSWDRAALGGSAPVCKQFIATSLGGSGIWETKDCSTLGTYTAGVKGNDGAIQYNKDDKITSLGGAAQTLGANPDGGKGGDLIINTNGTFGTKKGSAGSVDGSVSIEYKKATYTTHAGGGGASGSYAIGKEIPNEIIDRCLNENLNCKIKLVAGKRGLGSVSRGGINTNATDGGAGEDSIATVESNAGILWGYKVKGGAGGKGATTTASGGATTENAKCSSFNGTKWENWFNCDTSSEETKGKAGISGNPNGTTIFSTAAGGLGGSGRKNDYGNGGQGGSVLNKNITLNDLSGADGEVGDFYLEYRLLYKGAPGGGGGGGAMIRKENIQITPNKNYEIQIGGAGAGGTVNRAGYNGGDSIVNFSTILKAEGGKAGNNGIGPQFENDSTLTAAGIGGLGGKANVIESDSISGTRYGQAGQDGYIEPNGTGIGGAGGRSGISISLEIIKYAVACGGYYYNNDSKCENDNVNAFSGLDLERFSKPVEHIYKDGNYGSYGAGGGGGGWKYKESTRYSGKGGDGQGGYIYLWW